MAEGTGETGERKRGEEGGDLPQPDVPAGTGVTRRLDKLGVELSAEQYVPRDQREKKALGLYSGLHSGSTKTFEAAAQETPCLASEEVSGCVTTSDHLYSRYRRRPLFSLKVHCTA